jgi:hypothetical protein
MPTAVVPPVALPAAPPPEGQSRLIVDIVDGPARVARSHMESQPIDAGNGRTRFRFSTRLDVACPAAPCVLDVPRGNIVLGFPYLNDPDTFETKLIHVGPGAAVYRKALSYHVPTKSGRQLGGILTTFFGGSSATVGVVLLPIGLAKDKDGFVTAGSITLGAGAAMLAVGIWALVTSGSITRDGAENHFLLEQ